ncbi:hypothetical protein H5410_061037, partial [Solanum commersonii]
EGPLGVVTPDRRYTRRCGAALQNCSATRPLLLFIANLIFSFRDQHTGTLGEIKAVRWLSQWLRQSSGLLFFIISAAFKTQVHQFKKDVSNSATQDSIMNAHKKYQLTWARINCALNDSSCDSPLPNNLKLTILASNASLSSTKVFKCPHKKNDSIVTQWFNQLKFWNQDQHSQ